MQRLVFLIAVMAGTALSAQQNDLVPLSGYEFMETSTKQLQDDDFLNPAFFSVEKGQALWDRDWPDAPTAEARSCRSCHADPESSMRGVAARYPLLDPQGGGLINLEMKINRELSERLGAQPLAYESEDLLALTTLVSYQSRGMPMSVVGDDSVQEWVDRGSEIYNRRRGQLNLSCANCHQDHWGQKLRGDTISQGHINAFPIFRLTWGEMGSRHRMFTWCMESIRSEAYALGSEEFLALELFLALRGNGLEIEAPGVRR